MAMAKFALLALALFCMKVAIAQEVATDAAVTVEEEDNHRELFYVNPCKGQAANYKCEIKPYSGKYGFCCKEKCQMEKCPPPNPCKGQAANYKCELEPYSGKYGFCCKEKCQKLKCPPPNPCKGQKANYKCEIEPYSGKYGFCCKEKCQKQKCPPPNPCKTPYGNAADGTACSINPYTPGKCCRGQCALKCDPLCGTKVCKKTCCTVGYKKSCVDLKTDEKNCGKCGSLCKFTCVKGVCVKPYKPYY